MSLGGRVAAVLLLGSLAACGQESGPPASGDEPRLEARTPGGARMAGPPPLTLHRPEGDVDLEAWTWCYQDDSGMSGCADGRPPDDLPATRAAESLTFSFPLDGWEFTATFHKRGDCARRITLPVEQTGPTEFVVRPIGPAGDWDVDLFGRGDGDAITTFQWHTPVDGRLPEAASGTVGVLAEHDGGLDSYGVELSITDLAEQPGEATAAITVTSADGRTATIEPRRVPHCYSEGDVYFKASRAKGLPATRIGRGPFLYTVEVTLDGRTYVGTGEWPTDTNAEIVPHVPLSWEPALPAHGG